MTSARVQRVFREDQPFREPLRSTLTRTLFIAAALATAVIAWTWRSVSVGGAPRAWAALFLGFLWVSFGGHWPELAFINRIRPRLPRSAILRAAARVLLWLACGPLLFAAGATTYSLVGTGHPPSTALLRTAVTWGGPLFVGVEMVVHTIALALKRPTFWNGSG